MEQIITKFLHPKRIRPIKIHELPKFDKELFPTQNLTWGVNCKQNYEQRPDNPSRSDELPTSMPSFSENLAGLPTNLRYLYHNFASRFWSNKACTFDLLANDYSTAKPDNKGPSLGGIGTGNIIRSIKGDFTRWHLLGKAGINHNGINPVNNFHFWVKGTAGMKNYILNFNELDEFQHLVGSTTQKTSLGAWKFYCKDNKHYETLEAYFFARYPKSWYVYEEKTANIRVICKVCLIRLIFFQWILKKKHSNFHQ